MATWVRILRVTAAPKEASALLAEHREHVEALRDDGGLVATYALSDSSGFIDVFRAKDLIAAQAIATSSPLVERGLAVWQLFAIDEPGDP